MLTFVFVYLGMTALGLALEAVITILTPKFVPFFLFILVNIRRFCCLVFDLQRLSDYLQRLSGTAPTRIDEFVLQLRPWLPDL